MVQKIIKGCCNFIKNYYPLLTFNFLLLTFTSCYYDKEETLYQYYNNAACDTTNVSYSRTIVPIVTNYCSTCHSNNSANLSGYILTDYTDLKNNINKVWGCINHFSGYDAMPQGGNMLSPCD